MRQCHTEAGSFILTVKKSEKAFGVTLPKIVPYDNIDATAEFIIKDIITPALEKGLNK